MLVTLALAGLWWWLDGSLPLVDGERRVSGLAAPVLIHRDRQGLVDIQADSRADIAFALGFSHAQDRFFQMDLQRRQAAGELSALIGPATLGEDRRARTHRFRARARHALDLMPGPHRELIELYTEGVNQGLSALRSQPFEYAVLRADAEPWLPEDSVLCIYGMFLLLQDAEARFERGMGLMADTLPGDLFEFFAQQGGSWDAPLDGPPLAAVPVPLSGFSRLPGGLGEIAYAPFEHEDLLPGSNNWAVAGALTPHGGAIVANDMHLPIRVPNTWYRAAWRLPHSGRVVAGVTLPGMPALVAGSNGKLAWGFTNTQGDWSDVVILETDQAGGHYAGPDGWQAFETHKELIQVKGRDAEPLDVRETLWGPVIGRNHRGQWLALRWAAHDPQAANTALLALEAAESVPEALALAAGFGIPQQNLVLGDMAGNIGWTIAGPIPRRRGVDGRLPQPWHNGAAGWDGYYSQAEQPAILNPESGRIWTANSRVASGQDHQKIGSEGAALGARQQQIRERLLARAELDEMDMLALQLDDEALFLRRWRERLLAILDEPEAGASAALREARRQVLQWSGRAAHSDAGYRLVRAFRSATIERVIAPLETYLRGHDPAFQMRHVSRQIEYPVWALLEAQPGHLLNPDFSSWQALQLDAIVAVVEPLFTDGSLADDTWGEANRLDIHHPLVAALPQLSRWLSMPAKAMSGDAHMPRVQARRFGASERFGVAPGHEQLGYMHMATGQSAHPLSAYFRAGHQDWVEGRFSPFMSGPDEHRLRLLPGP